jgi:predicted type IV restriction endonuclease
MSDPQTARLQATIRDVIAKIQKYHGRSLGEENTKASLIEPVLEALGWDIRDPDEVHREFKPTTQDKPVDYALTLLRKPRLLVEAKALGETLSDRKWIGQILGYTAVAGVEWCVLTDGNEYRFYNATVPLDAEEKLFFRICLTDSGEDEAAGGLKLISKSDMAGSALEALSNAYFDDRRVKGALQEMVAKLDKGLIRLIRRKADVLTPKQIVESLRRLDIRIESPSPMPGPAARQAGTLLKRQRGERSQRKHGKKHFGVALADIIAERLITPPVRLFREYKGQMMEATVLPDGGVEFQGQRFDSCSTAAEFARSTVTGRRMHTNGWQFWQYLDPNGKKLMLLDVRERFLRTKGQGT